MQVVPEPFPNPDQIHRKPFMRGPSLHGLGVLRTRQKGLTCVWEPQSQQPLHLGGFVDAIVSEPEVASR